MPAESAIIPVDAAEKIVAALRAIDPAKVREVRSDGSCEDLYSTSRDKGCFSPGPSRRFFPISTSLLRLRIDATTLVWLRQNALSNFLVVWSATLSNVDFYAPGGRASAVSGKLATVSDIAGTLSKELWLLTEML